MSGEIEKLISDSCLGPQLPLENIYRMTNF